MKTLVNEEKYLLKEIVTRWKRGQTVCLADILDKFLVDIDIKIDYNKNTVELLFDQEKISDLNRLPQLASEKAWLLMRFVLLIKYYQGLDYMFLYQESRLTDPVNRFGQLLQGRKTISYHLTDTTILNCVLDYSYKTIVIGQILIDFVENNFRTREQIRHEENLILAEKNLSISHGNLFESKRGVKRSTIAIIVSVVVGLISLFTSIILSVTQSKVELKSEQYGTILKSLDSIYGINNSTNQFIKNIHLPDTLKTIIIKPTQLSRPVNK